MTSDTPEVALDITPLVGPRTGIGRFVGEVLNALPQLSDPPAIVPYVLSRRADLAGLPPATRRLPVSAGFAVRWWSKFDRPAFDRRLRGVDVIHGTNFVAPPSHATPRLLTVHDLAFALHPELCSPTTIRYGRVVRRAVRQGAWIHAPSEAVADEAREVLGTDRVQAVLHGAPSLEVSEVETPDTPFEGRPYVLALGRLEPRKRPALLVDAFGRVADRLGDALLIVAGPPGRASGDVETAITRLPVAVRERVIVTGAVTEEMRVTLLRHATVLAYPSVYEGFGFPLLEAMQAGVPAVTSARGGVPEVAGDAALVVGLGVDELADGLARVVNNDALRADLVDRGRRRVETFGWESAAVGLTNLYRTAARG